MATRTRKITSKKQADTKVEDAEWEDVVNSNDDTDEEWEQTEIPRHPTWNGPLVLPPGYEAKGSKRCPMCKRPCKSGRRGSLFSPPRNAGDCHCEYYKRTTTFIDVLQSEFALKMYDRRLVAYGMGQREDLQLAATAVRPDTDPDQTEGDKKTLQAIADAAKEAAKGSAPATVGTSLHTLTQWMDEGKTLGHVPSAYRDDLKAYEEATRGIEWVGIESFRVNDELRVAGTTDRLGWYKGRLRIFDVKTSPKENPVMYPHGPAMQLAMYARSTPYDVKTDVRVSDPGEIDLHTAMIIVLPARKGRCTIRPINIKAGWQACQLATQVWEWRGRKDLILGRDASAELADMAGRAGSLAECKLLWRNAKADGRLDPIIKQIITRRVEELRAQGITE